MRCWQKTGVMRKHSASPSRHPRNKGRPETGPGTGSCLRRTATLLDVQFDSSRTCHSIPDRTRLLAGRASSASVAGIMIGEHAPHLRRPHRPNNHAAGQIQDLRGLALLCMGRRAQLGFAEDHQYGRAQASIYRRWRHRQGMRPPTRKIPSHRAFNCGLAGGPIVSVTNLRADVL